jgi:hypothetical protein
MIAHPFPQHLVLAHNVESQLGQLGPAPGRADRLAKVEGRGLARKLIGHVGNVPEGVGQPLAHPHVVS